MRVLRIDKTQKKKPASNNVTDMSDEFDSAILHSCFHGRKNSSNCNTGSLNVHVQEEDERGGGERDPVKVRMCYSGRRKCGRGEERFQ